MKVFADPDSLGKVVAGPLVAELLEVDHWHVTINGEDDPVTARLLTAVYLYHYQGPQDGFYGERILQEAAKFLGGTYHYGPALLRLTNGLPSYGVVY